MIDLYELDLAALEHLLASWGETRELAPTIWHWLYKRQITRYNQMTSLPTALRERLAAETSFYVPPSLARRQSATGETRKDLLALQDGEQVEVVLLRYRHRHSACLSTQVGCACGCPFCATGQMGFVRDLTSGEIIAQALHVQRELAAEGETLSNVVLMGMGEPLLNDEAVMEAVRRLVDQRALGLAPGRVTLSTVGIPAGIERLAREEAPIKLAVSLHGATDAVRDQLVPINRRYPLAALFASLEAYVAHTKRRVMFEWVMLAGINDTPQQARALIERLANLEAHVNLIRLNPTQAYAGRAASPARIEAFAALLDQAHIPHTIRQRRGEHIQAGCGQLRSRNTRRTKEAQRYAHPQD